ncbi:restriction endonuclease subunit S [Neisseria sp. 83E34]|nr:restriction endonuclease subunit S [Neisseria sp. 83E34]
MDKAAYWAKLAEWILLENLFFRRPENISVQLFSQSFGSSGRLDAEYYQPKFDRLLTHIRKQKYARLGDLVDLSKSVEPGSEAYRDEGIPFVRVADLSEFGIAPTDKFLSPENFHDVIRPKKDTLLLSKDGTVGIAYRVPQNMNVITSGAIVHLNIKPQYRETLLPDYLALVLNSPAVRLQAERDAGGSIIQHWKPSEIKEVLIPILPLSMQKDISDKVQYSFMLKKQSENLLEETKKRVEQEIEN